MTIFSIRLRAARTIHGALLLFSLLLAASCAARADGPADVPAEEAGDPSSPHWVNRENRSLSTSHGVQIFDTAAARPHVGTLERRGGRAVKVYSSQGPVEIGAAPVVPQSTPVWLPENVGVVVDSDRGRHPKATH